MSEHEMERRARQALEALAAERGADTSDLSEVVVSRGRRRTQRRRAVGVTAGLAAVGVAGAVALNQLGPDSSATPVAPATSSLSVAPTTSTPAPSTATSTPTRSTTGTASGNVLGPQPDQLQQLPLGPAFQQEWLAVLDAEGTELQHRGTKVGPECIGLSLENSGPTGALVNCAPTGDVIETVWVKPDGSWTVLADGNRGGAALSPDGSKAAVLTYEGTGDAELPVLLTVDPSGRELSRVALPDHRDNPGLRGWSEAGVWLFDEQGMSVVDATGKVTLVAPGAVGMPLPGATPDVVGVLQRSDGRSCLVRAREGSETQTLRCTEPGRMGSVEASPSGRYVRFQDDPERGTEGPSEGWLLDLQSGETYSVPLFGSGGQARLTSAVTAWEDDHTLVINRAPYDREGPGGDWVRIDLTTGRAERMPPSDTVDLAIQRWG